MTPEESMKQFGDWCLEHQHQWAPTQVIAIDIETDREVTFVKNRDGGNRERMRFWGEPEMCDGCGGSGTGADRLQSPFTMEVVQDDCSKCGGTGLSFDERVGRVRLQGLLEEIRELLWTRWQQTAGD